MNWNMIGHEWAVDLLARHVASGEYQQAYLLTGPRGVGRRTLALRFAQALTCSQPPAPGQPCGACRNCTGFEKMQHPDLSVVQTAADATQIKVEQVRELQHSLALAPYQASHRVALLLRFEEATANTANALLKTLEEPPDRVVLLLTAESAESLLPTIVSRCEVLALRPPPLQAVEAALTGRWGLPPDEARLLAHISSARPGVALQLHTNPEQMEQRKGWLRDHQELLGANRVTRFAYADKVTKKDEKGHLPFLLETWMTIWRDVLLMTAGASAPLTNVDFSAETGALASACGLETAHAMLRSLEHTLEVLGRNVNARLAIEVLLLDLPRIV